MSLMARISKLSRSELATLCTLVQPCAPGPTAPFVRGHHDLPGETPPEPTSPQSIGQEGFERDDLERSTRPLSPGELAEAMEEPLEEPSKQRLEAHVQGQAPGGGSHSSELKSSPAPIDPEKATKKELLEAVIQTLAQIAGIANDPLSTWEAGLVRAVANTLGVDYESSMTTDDVFESCRERITEDLAQEMSPFMGVSVCMGWADGRLSPEEIEVMDAALSQLRILRRKRHELLRICATPIQPKNLADDLRALATDRSKAWMLLSLAWSVALADEVTHEGEMRTHQDLASYLGFSLREAALVRTNVEKRFHELHSRKTTVSGWKDAAMAAVSASGLDHYLHAATGLTTMNLFLSPFHLRHPQRAVPGSSHTDEARLSCARSEWILAPALVAGALFIADRAETENERRLLVAAVYLSEVSR